MKPTPTTSEPIRLIRAQAEIKDLQSKLDAAQARVTALEDAQAVQAKHRAQAHLDKAINAGQIDRKDTTLQAFWLKSIESDEATAIKALEALPQNPVLAKVVTRSGDPTDTTALEPLKAQEQKIAEIRAAHPNLDFQSIYAKAKADNPNLFR
jgi:hypothetical protein